MSPAFIRINTISDLTQRKGFTKRTGPAQGCFPTNTIQIAIAIYIVQNKTSSYLSTQYKQNNKQFRLLHTTDTKYKTHINENKPWL